MIFDKQERQLTGQEFEDEQVGGLSPFEHAVHSVEDTQEEQLVAHFLHSEAFSGFL